MAKNNQYTPGQLSLQYTIFIFCPVYFMHLCCDKQVIKWLPKPIHVSSGLFYYNSNSHEPDINSIKDSEKKLSEKVCFWPVFLQNTVLKCVSVVDFWNHATPYKESGERIPISNDCAYCECVYVQAGMCGIPRFFNANRSQSMSCDHFCVIIDWSSIGRCQSMPTD